MTTTITIALLPRLTSAIPTLSMDHLAGTLGPLQAGQEPQLLIASLASTPLGGPLTGGLLVIALLCGLLTSTATALIAAGGMMANDIFYQRLKRANHPTYRKPLTRFSIGLLLLVALAIAWNKPDDPLPLFLLVGALGLQLLPAIVGLCYLHKISGQAVRNGIFAGLVAIFATSTLLQGLASMVGLPVPFDAWPLSLHPAFWGLGANLLAMLVTGIIAKKRVSQEERQLTHARQHSYHVLPDGQALMAPDAPKWRLVALVIGFFFAASITLPLIGADLPDLLPFSMPTLWIWQFSGWLAGGALVYVVAYRLQPVFDPEQAFEGSFDPQKRRFRIKAHTRKIGILDLEPPTEPVNNE